LQLERARIASETLAAMGLPALILNERGKVLAANSLIEALTGYVQWRAQVGHIDRRLRGSIFHGAISIGAPTPVRFVETMRKLRHLQIPTTSATAPFSGPRCRRRGDDGWSRMSFPFACRRATFLSAAPPRSS
jgi:hypothetical protein